MKTNPFWGRCGVWCVMLAWMAISSPGGLLPPLYIGNLAPVRDQYGRAMVGSASPAEAANRSRIELRKATDGIVRPPTITGGAHPCNPLLEETSVGGIGQNAAGANSGLFCLSLSRRPAVGTVVFARVFNAPTATQATFYADSTAAVVAGNVDSLVLTFGPAQPLDSGDDDADGLNNSWEQALGTDGRPAADYDGDGMSDLHEMLAGTALDDPDSKLAFQMVRREPAAQPQGEGDAQERPLRVKWQSVPGKTYQLEYVLQLVPDPATGEPNLFIPVGDSVAAGAGEYEIERLVNISEKALTGAFRVKLVAE